MEQDKLNKWTELKHSKTMSCRFSAVNASEVQFCNICYTKIHVFDGWPAKFEFVEV
jgi:hypothetical protein